MSKQKGSGGDISNAIFTIGERVLCFHGPLIYEGKTLKIKSVDKEISYFIHYAGWSKTWDEWVPEKRVLKYSDENIKKQEELQQVLKDVGTKGTKKKTKEIGGTKKKSSVGSVAGDSTSGNLSTTDSRSSTPVFDGKGSKHKTETPKIIEEDPAKKKKKADFVEPETTFENKQEICILIPDQLKITLVDDWDFITRQKRLVNIPARHTVRSILQDYLNWVKENGGDEASAQDLCMGITDYFNVMVGNQLLYRYERQQLIDFEQKCKDENQQTPEMVDIYGSAHLLRLFTKLGQCLGYTSLDTEAVDFLCKCFEDFIKFLDKNHKEYFSVDDYGAAPPEYQRKGKKPFPPPAASAF